MNPFLIIVLSDFHAPNLTVIAIQELTGFLSNLVYIRVADPDVMITQTNRHTDSQSGGQASPYNSLALNYFFLQKVDYSLPLALLACSSN